MRNDLKGIGCSFGNLKLNMIELESDNKYVMLF